jgi:hypothetical protein
VGRETGQQTADSPNWKVMASATLQHARDGEDVRRGALTQRCEGLYDSYGQTLTASCPPHHTHSTPVQSPCSLVLSKCVTFFIFALSDWLWVLDHARYVPAPPASSVTVIAGRRTEEKCLVEEHAESRLTPET